MSVVLKSTTKLTGLAVVEKPREALSVLYRRILTVVQSMPKESGYRNHTEKLITERLSYLEEDSDFKRMERKYKVQMEELIWHAEDELKCARNMAKYKVWEPLVKKVPETQWKWPVA